MASDNLKQRKLRSSLTTLGVIVGITTIIALASLGEGFRLEVKTRMESGFELDVLIVFPGSVTAGLGEPFTPTDVDNIRSVANVSLVTPLISLPNAEIKRQNDSEKIGALSIGAINFTEMQEMLPKRFRLLEGRFPTAKENDTIILGYKTCFRNETATVNVNANVTMTMKIRQYVPALNMTVEINQNRTLKVVGILDKGGSSGITNFDYWAFIPTKLAVDLLGGTETYQFILVKVSSPDFSEQVANGIESKFENPYAISVFIPSSFVNQVNSILNLLQLFLMAIASISLLVAGIGIMNIMTVSVMERTREIGILKAIGAKSQTILVMFLAEAMLVGIVGGVIGMAAGYGLSYALAYMLSMFMQPGQAEIFDTPGSQALQINPVFTPEWTIIAFVFAIVICVIFGLYPARKASKLNPVEALRYE
jgi:putative ABC transport system permease protein